MRLGQDFQELSEVLSFNFAETFKEFLLNLYVGFHRRVYALSSLFGQADEDAPAIPRIGGDRA